MSKTLTFALVHFTVPVSVAYLPTGSVVVGGLLALVEPTLNSAAGHRHEHVRRRIDTMRCGVRAAPRAIAAANP